MKLSVVICTHNPRPDYLRRVLDALKAQTLPLDEWELLLVDNVSTPPLASTWDLSWHPHGRHIREEKIGVAHARFSGMVNSTGEILVQVDDDNVVAPDYLEQSLGIAREWTKIGAWSGAITGEFEITPPEHLVPFLGHLALPKVTCDVWGNTCAELPYGAGMGFRREVANLYIERVKKSGYLLKLGRTGKELLGGEDHDIARTSYDLGLGTALFTRIKLTHLIPSRRLTDEYILRIIRGNCASNILQVAIRGALPPRTSRIDEAVKLYKHWRATPWQRQVNRACEAGRRDAIAWLAENGIDWK